MKLVVFVTTMMLMIGIVIPMLTSNSTANILTTSNSPMLASNVSQSISNSSQTVNYAPTPFQAKLTSADSLDIVTKLEGISYGMNNGVYDGGWPPDPQIAVGGADVVELVNYVGEIWTTSGTSLSTFYLSSLFNTSNDSIGDPKIVFDSLSNRWFASVYDSNANSVVLAVSSSSEPLPVSSWHSYKFRALTNCPDQPLLGMSLHDVVISANDYTSSSNCENLPGSNFITSQYWVINKEDVLGSIEYPRYASFNMSSTISLYPVISLSSTSTEYLVTTGREPRGQIGVISVSSSLSGPPVIKNYLMWLIGGEPVNASQLGSTHLLDTGVERVRDAVFYDGNIWVTFNDQCVLANDTTSIRNCGTLAEFNVSTKNVTQYFLFGAPRSYYAYPSVSLDGRGDAVLVFGYSSATDYPGVMISAQTADAAPQTLETPLVLQAGTGPLTQGCQNSTASSGCRYGDYFGSAPDPNCPSVVWVAGEYGTGEGWSTKIAAVGINTFGLIINYKVSNSGFMETPPLLSYQYDGRSDIALLNQASTLVYADPGTNWNVSETVENSTHTERWITAAKTSGVVSHSATIDLSYEHQYYVTFKVNKAEAGTAGPSSGWFNAGQTIVASAKSNFGWWLSGWNGSGVGSYSGLNTNPKLIVRSAIVETATFVYIPPYIIAALIIFAVMLIFLRRRSKVRIKSH